MRALINGDFELAFHQNALITLLPFFMVTFIFLNRKVKAKGIFLAIIFSIIAADLIFVVLRNQEGSLLAPIG